MTWWLVVLIGWLVFLVWLAALVPSSVSLLTRTLDRRTAKLGGLEAWPFVSVIVPARDEADNIEESLRSLLNTDYPRIEIKRDCQERKVAKRFRVHELCRELQFYLIGRGIEPETEIAVKDLFFAPVRSD